MAKLCTGHEVWVNGRMGTAKTTYTFLILNNEIKKVNTVNISYIVFY